MGESIYNDIAAAFGTSFQPEEEETAVSPIKSLSDVQDTLKAKQELMVSEHEVLEDQSYIQQELRMDIEILGDVVEIVRSGITGSSNPNQVRSLVEAMKERREHLAALRDTNSRIHDIKYPAAGGAVGVGGPNITQNNLVMTGVEAMDMIRSMLDKSPPPASSAPTEYEEI